MRGRWGGFSRIALICKGSGPLPKLNVVGSIPIARSSFPPILRSRPWPRTPLHDAPSARREAPGTPCAGGAPQAEKYLAPQLRIF